MQTIFTLLRSFPYIDLPYHLLGWAGWFAMLALILWGCKYLWEPKPVRKNLHWLLLVVLILLTPLTSLFLGLRLPEENALPMPGLPMDPTAPALMFLAAIPWVLAGGLFGPVVAAALAAVSGFLLGLWETHTLFTMLELAGLALLFSAAVRQRYRTPFYRFIRHPFGAALLLAVAYAPVYVLTAFFATRGALAVRIDYALTQTWLTMLTNGAELLIAGLFAEVLYLTGLPLWGKGGALQPSPSETNLQLRFFYGTAPLVLALIFTLMVSDWIVAGNAARNMIRNRLSSTAQVAAESLPYFLETGQNLIQNLAADEGLQSAAPNQVNTVLANRLRAIPYFRQLFFFDAQGQPVTGYPLQSLEEIRVTQEEQAGIQLALRGVPFQTYTIRPWPGEPTAQVSFLSVVNGPNGQIRGVLLGRTDLNSNPFTQPAIQALSTVRDIGGEGIILDESNRILYHSLPNLVMSEYLGRLPESGSFFQDMSSTGVRQLVYYRPVIGRSWSVLMLVPAEQAQTLALEIAIPLLIMLLILSIATFFVLRLGLRTVTASLQTLAHESTLIARGQLDHPLQVKHVDEVGRLGRAFEQMRVSLKDRLEELNRLLMVSQGVASHLDAADAVSSILQAALGNEASSARIVLVREVTLDPHVDRPIAFSAGSSADLYAYLDFQIFDLMRSQDLLSIPNVGRVRRLNIPASVPQPGAVVALALHDENQYYGALWIAYDTPHTFTEEEIRFFTTLAGQAALAATNARLYATAEIGRQRLEAVLTSTPDPVLVIDEQMKLLLLNPAALQVSGLISSSTPGRPVRDIVCHEDLLAFIMSPLEEGLSSREITLPNSRIYNASVSMVNAESRAVGRICILRDITHYKQLDTLKSDFVSTVSHDLRSPLTLMRGYVTMLQMVGELNEQQKGYVRKIVLGVENMTRLVNNLLDLGRIEAGIGLQIEKVAIGEIIERVTNSLGPQASQKNIQLLLDRSAEQSTLQAVHIQADAALLEQAVYNLVENAIKYTNVGGNVNIGVQLRQTTVLFEVRDTGIGIAPLDLPHMFEKFYRSGRREAYQQRGTGLGLAIVKTIAERHGGRVWVESHLGKGSVFYLEVPFEQAKGEIS